MKDLTLFKSTILTIDFELPAKKPLYFSFFEVSKVQLVNLIRFQAMRRRFWAIFQPKNENSMPKF